MTVNAPTQTAPHFLDTAAAIASARRAAVADRYAIDSFMVEWREFSQLASIIGQWRELAARVLVANVFYEPAFALAAAPPFAGDAGAVLVWSGTGPRRLLGFFPARVAARRYGLKLPILVGWTHPYAPLGVPLVESEAPEPVVAAWLRYLATNAAMPGLLLLPFVPEQGPFAAALATILRRAQMPSAPFNVHSRALFEPRHHRHGYLERALGARQYREVRRTVRRLAERGALLFATATDQASVAAALEEFFALEAGGWKGKAGTAAACNANIRDFVQTAIIALAAEHKVAIDRLLLDGRAIAAAITLRSSDTAWFWKIAYDESLARFAPGVMLTASVTEQFADDAALASADSCATADHTVMNRTWSERQSFCDLLIAVRPQAPFARACYLEKLRTTTITAAKAIREKFH
jgi:CelD/BcsL family acetyltransferase involved in cellulose biosynthesis